MMTYNQRLREIPMITLHELTQGSDLLRSPRIFGLSMRIQPTLIADANRMAIMPHDMSPRLRDIPAVLDGAVTTHIFMITDAFPALLSMVGIDLRNGVMLMRHNPVAVNDNHINFTHNFNVL